MPTGENMVDLPTKYSFSESSKRKLATVHPRLRQLMYEVMDLQVMDFMVTEGARTLERQKELLAKGVTRTLKSKHIPDASGFSKAVDIVPFPVDYSDKDRFKKLVALVKRVAKSKGYKIRSGSDWDMNGVIDEEELDAYVKKFKRRPLVDYPHFELAE